MRITWSQAFAYCAQEIQRINNLYGPGAIYHYNGSHQWSATVHTQSWADNLLGAIGGFTSRTGGTTTVGWLDGSPLIWGTGSGTANSPADLIANCKVMIFWSLDPVRSSMTSGTLSLLQYAKAGIKFIVIDPRFNETALMFVSKKYPNNQWIPITPGTDSAMLAAMAYYWITNKLINTAYIAKYTIGYDMTTLPAGTRQVVASRTIFSELDRTRPRRRQLGPRQLLESPPIRSQISQ